MCVRACGIVRVTRPQCKTAFDSLEARAEKVRLREEESENAKKKNGFSMCINTTGRNSMYKSSIFFSLILLIHSLLHLPFVLLLFSVHNRCVFGKRFSLIYGFLSVVVTESKDNLNFKWSQAPSEFRFSSIVGIQISTVYWYTNDDRAIWSSSTPATHRGRISAHSAHTQNVSC